MGAAVGSRCHFGATRRTLSLPTRVLPRTSGYVSLRLGGHPPDRSGADNSAAFMVAPLHCRPSGLSVCATSPYKPDRESDKSGAQPHRATP
jgi:hypothetical protein